MEANTIKQTEIKKKLKKAYLTRTRKLLETKALYKITHQRDKHQRTMHIALNPRKDIDILYVSRKEGGIGLDNIGDCVDLLTQGFEVYIKKKN